MPKAVIDSGATNHFVQESYNGGAHTSTTDGIRVRVADRRIIKSTGTDQLPYEELPPVTRVCHKLPRLATPLLSVGKFCDSDMVVLFDSTNVYLCDRQKIDISTVVRNNEIIRGYRDPVSDLYVVPFHKHHNQLTRVPPSPTPPVPVPRVPEPSAMSAYDVQTVDTLMNFFHRTCLSVPLTTWKTAIDTNFFLTWPGLTAKRVQKYCTKKVQTGKGHMRMLPSNVRSTKLQPLKKRSKNRRVGVFVLDDDEMKNMLGMDFAGRYPFTSQRGNKYVFVMYDYDTNYINAIAVKARKTSEYLRAFQECYDELARRNLNAQLVRLDNEVSRDLIACIEDNNLDYQIVSSGTHRSNPAERAIQTFKSYFLSARAGADPTFPKNCWDYLIPQTVIIINLLRPSRINPAILAYT